MKLIVECAVTSNVVLPRRLEFRSDGRVFIVELDVNRIWNQLRIVVPVPKSKEFKWGIETVQGTGGPDYMIHADAPKELYDSVLNDIQALESVLALFVPLASIDWRHPTLNVEYEAGEVPPPLHTLEGLRKSPRTWPVAPVSEAAFVQATSLALSAEPLKTAASFWREGENDMHEERYINAFFNFYFVLEGLFGNGKFKSGDVEREFVSAAELRQFTAEFCTATPLPERIPLQISALLLEKGQKTAPTFEILMKLLVSVRGRLHHFSNNPGRSQGSPNNQDPYEGISTFARFLAHKALMKRVIGNRSFQFQPVA